MADTPDLNIHDLAILKSVIEVACSRGAITATEMRVVGETYDKLTAFLDAVVAQAKIDSQSGESDD